MMNLRSGLAVSTTTPLSHYATRRLCVLLALAATMSQEANATPLRMIHHSVDAGYTGWVNATDRACEGEVPGKSPLQIALRHYVKGADPIPRRFLTVVGSDSALSEMGTKVLAEYGPTYYWAGSDKSKADLREKLERVGPYPALLVVVRANKKVNATTQEVRLGGHYLTGEFDGKLAVSRQYTVTCGAAGWTIKGTKVESAT